MPISAKNAHQARSSRFQTGAGRRICLPMSCRRGALPSSEATPRAAVKHQYRMVGFHLMKDSSCSSSVMPPKTTMMTSPTHCMVSIGRRRISSQPIWATLVAMATAVAT